MCKKRLVALQKNSTHVLQLLNQSLYSISKGRSDCQTQACIKKVRVC